MVCSVNFHSTGTFVDLGYSYCYYPFMYMLIHQPRAFNILYLFAFGGILRRKLLGVSLTMGEFILKL